MSFRKLWVCIDHFHIEEKQFGSEKAEDYLEHWEEKNVKQILHDVLNELYYSKSKKKL
jgi:predicted thioredoxin/glutaredoxin